MSYARPMMESHPSPMGHSVAAAAEFIDAAVDCAQACTACADACLAEEKVENLRRCIRVDLDCADVTQVAARVVSRQTHPSGALLRAQVEACETACRVCAEECEQHGSMHEHCRVCAEACRRCEEACRALLDALPS